MSIDNRTAISPGRNENFPLWYQSVVREAQMAEMAHVRGCMVIKPWGYGIWEKIQAVLGDMIKKRGVENAYFPLFVPLGYIQKEADHVEGFAKEMAVVTHHRLEKQDGRLVPAEELTEPVVVRPTSEAIIGESFASWITSYRDLPIKINQWCNVVRWEMRPRVFLRTTEFLWQEGHNAFATADEATADALEMIDVYRNFLEDWLAIPVIQGKKPPYDRFPGAVDTFTVEAMMQDGKALQAGTSHNLGQNFAKAANITFSDRDGADQYVHTTSWGVSTRLIGALVMSHADDDGMRVPPKIAPQHIAVIPIVRGKDEQQDHAVVQYARDIAGKLSARTFAKNIPISAKVDSRLVRPAEKKWKWIKKGVPIQIEVGPRDLADQKVVLRLRSEPSGARHELTLADCLECLPEMLARTQQTYYNQARERLDNSIKAITGFSELEKAFKSGCCFVKAPWFPSDQEDPRLKDMGVTIRCVLFKKADRETDCVLTGKQTAHEAIFAKAY